MAERQISLFDTGPPQPCPAPFNIAGYVLAAVASTPDKIALGVIEDADGQVAEAWSFRQLEQAIRSAATALKACGLSPGDRVALRIENTAAFPIFFFATIAAGGIAAPTSAQLTGREFHILLEDMGAKLAIMSETLRNDVPKSVTAIPAGELGAFMAADPAQIVATGPEDPAFLIYTSGASGRPKGVLHAQRSAWARRMMWRDWYGLSANDTMLHAGAFNWTYTLGTGLTDPWAAGASTLIYTGPKDAGIWPGLIAQHKPTLFAAVPGVYRSMLRQSCSMREVLSPLRHALTAGERMPETVSSEWLRQTGKPVNEALGMSEISTYISVAPGSRPPPGSCGRPQSGRRVAIIAPETGEPLPIDTPGILAVSKRDPGLMLGYWNRPEETAAAFRGEWFLTGDRARMDRNGYITYLGRADEVMTSLGYRVSPQEVEEVLAGHVAISEVAVAELPVRDDLSLIAAFIVASGEMPGDADLAAFAARRLAAYKCPRLWIRVDNLPRSANGKLLRKALISTHRRDREK